MGIIKAAANMIGGALADQWLEVIEPDHMGDTTVFTSGVTVRKNDRRSSNTKGTVNTVSDGSVIHVYANQFMMLVDGGKIVDYTAEEGYYVVNNASMPSLMNGQLDETIDEAFNRFRFGGVTPAQQKVYFVNLQEIKGIKFGTRNPVNYFDNAYNAELFLRAHGTYSVKITNPLLFYKEAIPHDRERVDIEDINEQYLSEFMEALQAAINQMSADGVRISYVTSKGRELSRYMSTILDEDWNRTRGLQIQSVGIASISYDEESTRLIHMRNQGAMLSDPSVREGFVQGAAARGLEAAGSNPNGAMAGFIGVNMGAQGGSAAGAFSQSNQQQMQRQQEADAQKEPKVWTCSCGTQNSRGNRFCKDCGKPKPQLGAQWVCPECGASNDGKFCGTCGHKRPAGGFRCDKCGYTSDEDMKFCPECGDRVDENDRR